MLASALVVACSDAPALVPQLSYLQEFVFTPRCANPSCHGAGTGLSRPERRPLDLRAGQTHSSLVQHVSYWRPDLARVAPGDPDASFLVEKVASSTPSPPRAMMDGYVNDRMPPGCEQDRMCLAPETVALIREWIARGAQND